MRDLNNFIDQIIKTDVLIIGSEGAGARAAIEVKNKGLNVVVVTKGYVGRSGATLTADADIDLDSKSCVELFGLPGDLQDSPEKFFEDIIIEGEYLNNQRLVEIHVKEAPKRIKELVSWGAKIDKLTHAPGHKYPRGIWIPGTEFARVLKKEIKKRNISFFEHIMITDLIVENGKYSGAIGINMINGEFYLFQSKAVIICAGGAMRLYLHTTAPEELTGDALAMAFRSGVELIDMEFPMFLPYTLIQPPALDGVDFSYLLSAYIEVHALNREGKRYMRDWDPSRLEKSTRDINSIAAGVEILKRRGSPNGGTYLSLKHLPDNLLSYSSMWFPESISKWKYGGFNMKEFLPDLNKNALETAPASHFWNGGIKIDEKCQTNILGIYAAGEGTGGINGANRISGNALTMTQVWGPRAGKYAAEYAEKNNYNKISIEIVMSLKNKYNGYIERKDGVNPIEIRKRIRKLAWENVGIVRDGKILKEAIKEISILKCNITKQSTKYKGRIYNKEWIEALQNENMLQVLEIVAKSSLIRNESRGALYRVDYQETNNVDWIKNINVKKCGEEMEVRLEPSIITSMKPTKEVHKYGAKE
jgi:succinate dehydrogenase/fumarate reductase flavoprotein subunit